MWSKLRMKQVMDSLGVSPDKTGKIRQLKVRRGEHLDGGRADGLPDGQFDPTALQEGEQHEMEHTTDRALAREIAKDHLAEDPQYYSKLKQLEKGTYGNFGMEERPGETYDGNSNKAEAETYRARSEFMLKCKAPKALNKSRVRLVLKSRKRQ